MSVIELTDEKEFNKLTEEKDTLIVIDCSAVWCKPCNKFSEFYDKFVYKYDDTKQSAIRFLKMNVDNNEFNNVVNKYDISSLPTILFFKNEKLIDRIEGNKQDKFVELIEKLINF